jgi:hypothetical protein
VEAGGSTPRSGLNRREKEEERRKELNRMRDEYIAKRQEESVNRFVSFFQLVTQISRIF